MKKIWIVVTAGLAVMILTAGVALLPAVYSVVFDAEGMIAEEEPLPEEIFSAVGLFMDRFRYPMSGETEMLPEEERENRRNEGRAVLGDQVYERLFRLVGLEEEDCYWEELSVVKGGGAYLIRTQAEKEGGKYDLSAAMDDRLLPYLICCRSVREPLEEEIKEAEETLLKLCNGEGNSLRLYTEKIDEIYDNCQDYKYLVRELYIALLSEEWQSEISEEISLWDCCALGEWQVCRDEGEVLLVCVMGQGSLVLYYDAVEKGICGYRILFRALA